MAGVHKGLYTSGLGVKGFYLKCSLCNAHVDTKPANKPIEQNVMPVIKHLMERHTKKEIITYLMKDQTKEEIITQSMEEAE